VQTGRSAILTSKSLPRPPSPLQCLSGNQVLPKFYLDYFQPTKKLPFSTLGGKMLKELLLGAIVSSMCLCFGLSSHGDSGNFAMDTVDPELQLISPVGSELWYIGDSRNILWSAVDDNFTENPISLWYRTANGTPFQILEENLINTGSYSWLLPAVHTDQAKVQINAVDSFGNTAETISPLCFSIHFIPPANPENVVVNTGSGLDAELSWDPVSTTIPPYNTSITPDGYIILYNETPYENEHYYYFLGRSFTNSYTHHDVLEFRDQMFYLVKAYKNYSRAEAEALEELILEAKTRKIRWSEAEDILKRGYGK